MFKYSIVLTSLLLSVAQAQNTDSNSATIPQTSTTQINQEAPAAANPWSLTTYFLGGYSDQQFRQGDPSVGIFDSYLSLNYSVNSDIRVSARPAFSYNSRGVDNKGKKVEEKFSNRDFSFAASVRNILKDTLDDSLSLKFKPRLYLPTSDYSKDQGMIARLRLEWELRYYMSRNSKFNLVIKPSYYFQRNTTWVDYSIPGKPRTNTTTMADSENYIEYVYDLNKTFSLKPTIGNEETWSNVSPNSSNSYLNTRYRKSTVYYGGGVEVNPSRDWGFTLGVRTTKNVYNPALTEETSYTMLFDAVLF